MSWCEASHYGRPSPSALVGTIRTQFMFFFTPSDKKKNRFQGSLQTLLLHKTFFILFYFQNVELEEEKKKKVYNTAQTAKCSFALFSYSFLFCFSFFFIFILNAVGYNLQRVLSNSFSFRAAYFLFFFFLFSFFSFRLSSRLLFYFIRLPSPFLLRFVIFLLNTPPYKLISLQLI